MIYTIMAKKVVTNLRIDENDWLQVKAMAAEAGMSINEYLNLLTQNVISKARFGFPIKFHRGGKRKSIYDLLPSLLKKRHKAETFELSEEDKIIYGL